MSSTTPKERTRAILGFCDQIVPGGQSVYVPVQVRPGGRASYCYPSVEQAVAEEGGEIIFGWMIWEMPGRLIEAEHHACWRKQNGAIVDVTPKPDGEATILFLPDPDCPWEGKPIRNIRKPLIDDAAMRQMLAVNRVRDELRDKYWKDGDVIIPPEVEREAMRELTAAFTPGHGMIPIEEAKSAIQKVGRNEPCPCGSGKKYKKCHGAGSSSHT